MAETMKKLYEKCTDEQIEGYLAQFLHIHRALYKEADEAGKHFKRVELRYIKAIHRYSVIEAEWRKRQKGKK